MIDFFHWECVISCGRLEEGCRKPVPCLQVALEVGGGGGLGGGVWQCAQRKKPEWQRWSDRLWSDRLDSSTPRKRRSPSSPRLLPLPPPPPPPRSRGVSKWCNGKRSPAPLRKMGGASAASGLDNPEQRNTSRACARTMLLSTLQPISAVPSSRVTEFDTPECVLLFLVAPPPSERYCRRRWEEGCWWRVSNQSTCGHTLA